MPIGQSDGCLSTAWYQPRCVMVNNRPAQRDTDAGSISRSAHTRGPDGLRITVSTARRRCAKPIGQSDGCLSTAWYRPRCAMVKNRPAQRIMGVKSVPCSAHSPHTVRCKKMVHTSTLATL